MKTILQIETIIDKPQQLNDMVEKLVIRKTHSQSGNQLFLNEWLAIEISSAEAHINGTVTVNNGVENAGISFITPFLFSCVKSKSEDYKIEWSVSLS